MGPLRGYTVLELAGIGPAPMGGMLLADMGAEVIRIERVGAPDPKKSFDWPLIATIGLSVATIGASVFGYAALARYIIEKAIFLSLLAGYLFLFRSFFQSWILLAVERLIFGSVRTAPDPNDVVAFWTRLSVYDG